MIHIEGKFNQADIYSELRDEGAIRQVEDICSDETYKDAKIKVMPDYHPGKGCVIGLTMKMPRKGIVNPNFVGVDIGCGILALKLSKRPDLNSLDDICHRNVPTGPYFHKEPISPLAAEYIGALKKSVDDHYKLERQLGTLGGGNHFIEVDQLDNDYYLVIHSGSRNVGLQVAESYAADYEKGELDMEAYLQDMQIMQQYASDNRKLMAQIITRRLKVDVIESIESIHNYIELQDDCFIVRKGSISAKAGEKCVIPLNMRDGTIIGIGKGNEDWNQSAPHGAGRALGRGQAFKQLSLEKFEESMKGIYSTTVCKGTLDEAPMAYKPSKYILNEVTSSIDVIGTMKSIFNFKAVENKQHYRKDRYRKKK